MSVNPCDCNFKICYRVTNGVTSKLGSVFLTISVILLSKYMSSKMFCPLLLIPRTANVFKRFYYWQYGANHYEKQLMKIFKVHTAAAAITVN